METVEAYLVRKSEELGLLNGFLANPLTIRHPRSAAEVIEQKFHLAAALKAEHQLHDWATTETAWTHSSRPRSGPFEFKYDYQRADLEVRGPSFYSSENGALGETIYTASGMAAISAVLMASALVLSKADIFIGPNSYGETIELIDSHAKHLRRVELDGLTNKIALPRNSRSRILLLDSCTSAVGFEAALQVAQPHIDLIIFDTTCFAGGSRRIGRVLRWARKAMISVVMVRSHNKLDSLGVEYGRLGSAVFIENASRRDATKQQLLQRFLVETRNAVRLFGGAALPAHFPPYVGGTGYRRLTDQRVARMLQNSIRTKHHFSTCLAGLTNELHFTHGLYVTLAPARRLDENQTRELTAELCDDLSRAYLPVRHAGSFGFDFGAAEWCRDRTRDRYVVRLAIPDLPGSLWDEVTRAVADWWMAHERSGMRSSPDSTSASKAISRSKLVSHE
ncbi:MAG: hypothetical protein KGL35_17800 [Bradyrhizobium sp.]|uniref:hypothetical protein n=1 Tax=Bradyrhizobium sp. TaxID=376 RepID=UPI001C2A39C1|nr:hypothetical protein [Bradyrhizobium sp.]MBU6462592.1 hypothetical protein [Pseudomonadota bacterium]MDE2067213.1 hypothetical protein [Bradyrhizobium sp.]MDE2470543.1 hypothetical protein [Bradyrhizobium sp.]